MGQGISCGLLVSGALSARFEEKPWICIPTFCTDGYGCMESEGGNDMVFETIRSLQMEPCVLYAGTVKRRNIGFDIRQMEIEEGETYDKAKQRVVADRVEDFLDGHKTILYYPFAGGIDMRLKTWVKSTDWHLVASYYGKKDKRTKSSYCTGVQRRREANDCGYKGIRHGGGYQ